MMYYSEVTSSRSYLLHCWSEQPTVPGEPLHWRFVLQEVSRQSRQEFHTFEQVINFLLDELFGQSKEVGQNEA